jgi:adenosylcobinamide amidohydrolase
MAWEPRVDHIGGAGEPPRAVLVWRFEHAMLTIASAPIGGGIGPREWVLNAQVPSDYSRTDIDVDLSQCAETLGCTGTGVGFLTAAAVEQVTTASDDGVTAYTTVGLTHPTWAAAPAVSDDRAHVGTINIVAFLPVRLADAGLVSAVMTATEAKTQALVEAGVPGTGTASDAVCILTPIAGPTEAFGGPRSTVGAPLARAVHSSIVAGIERGTKRGMGRR